MKTLIQKFPQMPLILYENYTVKLLEQMRTGELDVAILAEPFDTTGLDIQPLYDEEFFVTVPKGHPWEGLKSVQSAELREQTMLLLGIGHCFRDHVLEVCPEAARYAQNSAGIQKTFEGSSLETIRHMVASGLGITVLPRMAIPPDNQDPMLSFIPFTPPAPTRRVVMVSRKSFSRQSAVESLRSVISEADLPGCTKLLGAASFAKAKAAGVAA